MKKYVVCSVLSGRIMWSYQPMPFWKALRYLLLYRNDPSVRMFKQSTFINYEQIKQYL